MRSFSQETIEDIDRNGDGLIDLQEYIGKKVLACSPAHRHVTDGQSFRKQLEDVRRGMHFLSERTVDEDSVIVVFLLGAAAFTGLSRAVSC